MFLGSLFSWFLVICYSICFMPVEACACDNSSTGLNGRQSLSAFFSTVFSTVFSALFPVFARSFNAGLTCRPALRQPFKRFFYARPNPPTQALLPAQFSN
jgi:hypothetical protein